MYSNVSFIVLLEGGPACGRSLTEVGMAKVMQQSPKIVGPAGGVIVSCPGRDIGTLFHFVLFEILFNNEASNLLTRYNLSWGNVAIGEFIV